MYVRCMKDTFVIFKNNDCSNEFLKSLFNLHPSLKYTREDEQQSTISFFDVSVQRNDNGKYNTKTYKNQNSSIVLFRGLPFILKNEIRRFSWSH